MSKRVKGFALVPVLLIIGVSVVVGAAVGAGAMYYYMSTHQGGLGDGEEAGITLEDADRIIEDTAASESLTEPESTEPVTENLNYISITVTGRTYEYKAQEYPLDRILGIIETNPGLPVRVTDEGASLSAYNALITALQDMGVSYVETGSG